MRALTVCQPGTVRLEVRPDITAGPGEVLIAPSLVGMCGTDLEIIDGRIDPAFVNYPIVIGHEWVGTVVGGDPAIAPGTRVVVEGVVTCGRCAACAAGDTNRCEVYDEFGFSRDGAAADLLAAPTGLVYPLSEGVSMESGALVEPAAVVYRALARGNPTPGQRVLVVGDGTVAGIAVALVRLWSPASVTVLGARPEQEPLLRRAGADRFTIDPASAGSGYDLVVEAAGSALASEAAFAAPGRGGTVVMIGYPGADVAVPVVIDDLINGDVSVLGSFSYTTTAWRSVVALLNAGRLDLSFLVTHRFALDRYADALEALRHPTGTRGKVLLEIGSR